MRRDSDAETGSVPNLDRRMAAVPGPFTALSAEGGLRPGIYAGLGGDTACLIDAVPCQPRSRGSRVLAAGAR